jgi:predicted DNA-binding transcriptional regulator YafY
MPGPHKNYADLRETIQVLNDAVLSRRTLKMRYRTGRTGTISSRGLDPYRVWYQSGGLYVVGFDHKSAEIRTFAVDRIRALEAGTQHFEPDSTFDFDTYLGGSFGVIAEPATRVRIRFDRRWATYIEERIWHGSQRITKRTGGKLELEMHVGGTVELRTWILSFGSGAEVLEPASLRDEVLTELRAALSRYASPSKASRPVAAPRPRADRRTARGERPQRQGDSAR